MTNQVMSVAARGMTHARSNLVLEEPFFGVLAMQLTMFEDPSCETAWTDGTNLGYNPAYVEPLPLGEKIGLVCH
jgi:hypothetical protein